MGRPRIYKTDEERRAYNADRIRRWRRENPEKVYASRLRAAARLIERNESKKSWVMIDFEFKGETSHFMCSVCGNIVHFSTPTKKCEFSYCPHCGAKMDEEATT